MRSLLLVLTWAGACGAPSAPAVVEAPRAPGEPYEAVPGPEMDLLPAGLYWLGYATCEECPPPRAASLAVARSVEEAERLVAAAPDALPPGYPLVVHADELSLGIEGIAVVFGLHQTRAGAGELAARVPEAGVVELAASSSFGDGGRVVVRIAAGPPVAAFARDRVRGAEDAPGGELRDPEALAGTLEPLCLIEGGRFFVAEERELEWYRWAPVRCGEDTAFVPWRVSLLGFATILRGEDGYVVRQVTRVECDMATIDEWPYDPERRPELPPLVAGSGC